MTESVGNHTAPPGFVYVCAGCGKRSRDKYGDEPIDYGWDESCMMHAVLCDEKTLIFGENGRVTGLGVSPEPALQLTEKSE
jgi:hypothetical protein